MRIINTDNHGGDYPDEKFLCCGKSPLRFNLEDAKIIQGVLNKKITNDSPRYWRIVEDDYKLQPGFEP